VVRVEFRRALALRSEIRRAVVQLSQSSTEVPKRLTFDDRRVAQVERGYEGYVAKDEASLYEAGATRRWLKVKQPGWTVAEDRWQRRISAGA
jgi:ATP-dependent DNA ligase